MHTLTTQPQRLPTEDVRSYRDDAGNSCLVYPRAPRDPQRYVVYVGAQGPDLECVHDDFGGLVPMRQRFFDHADWSTAAAWEPLQ